MASDQDTDDSGNDLLGRMIQSFIIKIWREEPDEGKPPKWRGYITHVPSQERRYLRRLEDVTEFVSIYIERMGVRVGGRWRWEEWFKRQKST